MEEDSNQIQGIQSRVDELKHYLTEARKKGGDTRIAEIKFMNIPSKISYARVTGNKKDIQLINLLLDEVDKELNDVYFEENIQKEAEQVYQKASGTATESSKHQDKIAQLSEEQISEKINILINDALNYLFSKKYYDCFREYKEISGMYKYLPDSLKKKHYEESMAIYQGLAETHLFAELDTRKLKDKGALGRIMNRFRRR